MTAVLFIQIALGIFLVGIAADFVAQFMAWRERAQYRKNMHDLMNLRTPRPTRVPDNPSYGGGGGNYAGGAGGSSRAADVTLSIFPEQPKPTPVPDNPDQPRAGWREQS